MDKALQTMIDNMPEKTGKSLTEWKSLLKSKTFVKHSEAVNYLKKEHNVTHGFANTIVSLSKEEKSNDKNLVAEQYKGKENLLPIFESLISLVKKFGSDVKITPKKTEVSLDRKRKFAVIKPATKSRIDLGLKLKDKLITERLENYGSFGTMCTHRVRLTDISQIDSELKELLKEAYLKAE
ncbi:DUF4287 domain-containing protein [Lacinutrix neustonica]|uniref:DUF4287 domain-containing protein n=1 Tax=Lacinutrix neustonica TaxID=2980107 RepID=A0A9E8MY90_9FLAO|nr:DUF4287 domain-containing protein [Lacinutrix neustonica]WAC03007.1 DUF4287 domain-containing protein [Lacinutrix neustonica]WAC03084.1 DUF4287 domain-containing protein [Lacinutrix neustonica]